jgi:ABC-type bacteriocin/lantibiotic exporter with double-glycine peptidase domain
LSSVTQQRSSHWLPAELAWLIKEIRPLLHWHLASFVCITCGSLLALLSPLLLKWLIDGIIPQQRIGLLLVAVALIFLGHQGRVALTSLGSYLMLSASQKMGLTQRVRLLKHLDTLSADYYDDTPVGSAMYPLKEPIEEISYFGSESPASDSTDAPYDRIHIDSHVRAEPGAHADCSSSDSRFPRDQAVLSKKARNRRRFCAG